MAASPMKQSGAKRRSVYQRSRYPSSSLTRPSSTSVAVEYSAFSSTLSVGGARISGPAGRSGGLAPRDLARHRLGPSLGRAADHPVLLGDVLEDDVDAVALGSTDAHERVGDRLRDGPLLLDRTTLVKRNANDRHGS